MSDNGKQFDNTKFRDFCAELGIKNYYSSPAHPQSNGQAEVTIRTLKAALKTKLEDLKGSWVEYLPEVLQVQQRTEEYQRKTARYYNKRVKPRSYVPGDLVLKKLLPARKNPAHGKLGPNWEGPYIISRVVRPGNYELQTEEGKILQHTWNAEHLKRFYQ